MTAALAEDGTGLLPITAIPPVPGLGRRPSPRPRRCVAPGQSSLPSGRQDQPAVTGRGCRPPGHCGPQPSPGRPPGAQADTSAPGVSAGPARGISPDAPGERVPQPPTSTTPGVPRHELLDEPALPSIVEFSTEELLERFGELAPLRGMPCRWVDLAVVELVVGYLAVPNGLCTLYIGATETSVCAPGDHGTVRQYTGPLTEMIPIAHRAATAPLWPSEPTG